MSSNSWDVLFSSGDYYFGTEPNDFLRENSRLIPKGSEVLCLGAGEGRNAVFLAELGHRVTAIDQSAPGMAKLERLARERGVTVDALHADLVFHDLGRARWDAIVWIWPDLPHDERLRIHPGCVEALKPGGVFLLEALAVHASRLDLIEELAGLHVTHAVELERELQEGTAHRGTAAVVQLVGKRPL
ncbi:MAG TPA: class I SAM-dependent methyltransferase [Bdellovibrionota bacterium]|nr:class I SAM-dependent methyltransferase [Bdellovibrionota bacterium]